VKDRRDQEQDLMIKLSRSEGTDLNESRWRGKYGGRKEKGRRVQKEVSRGRGAWQMKEAE